MDSLTLLVHIRAQNILWNQADTCGQDVVILWDCKIYTFSRIITIIMYIY